MPHSGPWAHWRWTRLGSETVGDPVSQNPIMALKTRFCLSPWGWFQLHGHLEAQTADISLGAPVPKAPHLCSLEARSQDPGAEEQIEMLLTLPLSTIGLWPGHRASVSPVFPRSLRNSSGSRSTFKTVNCCADINFDSYTQEMTALILFIAFNTF